MPPAILSLSVSLIYGRSGGGSERAAEAGGPDTVRPLLSAGGEQMGPLVTTRRDAPLSRRFPARVGTQETLASRFRFGDHQRCRLKSTRSAAQTDSRKLSR